eukprot:645720-Pelagomonas_calceolata.AAC.1
MLRAHRRMLKFRILTHACAKPCLRRIKSVHHGPESCMREVAQQSEHAFPGHGWSGLRRHAQYQRSCGPQWSGSERHAQHQRSCCPEWSGSERHT